MTVNPSLSPCSGPSPCWGLWVTLSLNPSPSLRDDPESMAKSMLGSTGNPDPKSGSKSISGSMDEPA